MADSGLEESLTKGKIGKVPVWGVGVALAAAFIIFMYLRNRNASSKAANTSSSSGDAIDPATGLPYSQETGTSVTGVLDPTNPAAPVGLPQQGLPAPQTNVQWSRLAFDSLIALGDDPTLVENALAKYLAGIPLSQAENAVIELAKQMFGAPPEGLIGVVVTPPTGGTGGGTGSPVQTGSPGGSQRTGPVSTASVKKYWHVDEWITDMNTQGLASGLTYGRLVSLNPQIAANIVWHSNSALNTFKNDATYRIV